MATQRIKPIAGKRTINVTVEDVKHLSVRTSVVYGRRVRSDGHGGTIIGNRHAWIVERADVEQAGRRRLATYEEGLDFAAMFLPA